MAGSYPHPNPDLARAGVRQFLAGEPGGGPSPQDVARAQRRAGWTAAAPSLRVVHAGFSGIPWDADVEYTAASAVVGNSYAYKLASFSPKTIGDEFGLLCVRTELMPADSTADGAAYLGFDQSLPWGDARGLTAQIVVSRNLPGGVGEWHVWADGGLPGLNLGLGTTQHARERSSGLGPLTDHLAVTGFPPGTFRDATPSKSTQYFPFSGSVARFTQGDSLDVSLVLGGYNTIANWAPNLLLFTGTVIGFARVSCTLATVVPSTAFGA